MNISFPDGSRLANIYWMIRASRFHRDYRKYYRRAKREAERLHSAGYDPELIRLYRLYLSDPRSELRQARFIKLLCSMRDKGK